MCAKSVVYIFILSILIYTVDSGRVRHHSAGKQALKFLKGIGVHNNKKILLTSIGGIWPNVFNLATKAVISVNATCGEGGREEFGRMSEGLKGRYGICDHFSPDPGKRHPIHYAIDDGSNRWWQSPALHYGIQYEYVTITLDLKQVYQVAHVIIKAANSPRPGAWILERSIDGVNYEAWQYFATSDKDCLDRYGVPARKGKPHYFTDSEVICTSFYSKLTPMENGEIHTFLIHGRPGANETSPELLQFTKARYVRLRLQGFRGSVEPLPGWLSQDDSKDKRLYYSIRDISIGGQCVCNGHASSCRHNVASGHPECECSHFTYGPNCEKCSPLYNQRQWGPGSSRDAKVCLPCNCHGHATSCHYDENVDRAGLSLDFNGYYQGGGVCDNCTTHTTGINCELCMKGYYRPYGCKADSERPCVKCDCDPIGSAGHCILEDRLLICECRPGFGGARCDTCLEGYRGYPNCEMCPCDARGVVPGNDCEGDCICKANVDGKFCDRCKVGYFSLQADNPEGCSQCYCSGTTTLCESAHLQNQSIFVTDKGWLISDISVTEFEEPSLDERGMISVGNYEIPGIEAYYWLAPDKYLGNKLVTYGSELMYKVHWVVMRGDTSGKPTTGPNIVLVGENGMRIAAGDDTFTETNMTFHIKMTEYHTQWYHVPLDVKDIITRLRRTEYRGEPVTRFQFLSVLTNIKHLLLRAKFHTDQIEGSLEEALLYSGGVANSLTSIEDCSCPSGYTGLSCEACQFGYVRIFSNTSSHQEMGFCVKCDCNGHSNTCNPDTGECFCEHNTIGETCERCLPGYYGNPVVGSANDCKKCACPLEEDLNNFSPSCQLDSSSLSNDDDEAGFVCTQCPKGYTGDHCEICDDGYFGVPSQLGGQCELCSCGGGPCDRITGQCLGCRGNTEGWRCERCKSGFFGDPLTGCEACLCDMLGSVKQDCNNVTGECECKQHFIGRTCNKCEVGYGNVTAHCTPCVCNLIGSKSDVCDPHSGLCDCQSGVEGFHCTDCQHLHYGFSETGCLGCNCNKKGSLFLTCDIKTGQCRCKPHYIGKQCEKCENGYWDSPEGCVECSCDIDGSHSQNCEKNGRCNCKPGITGDRCDSCLPGFYGFSKNGCKECDACNKKGHICDPDTGRCVCPPFSHGESCHLCSTNTWGHEPNKGCKACNCSPSGSTKMQCDLSTGSCTCMQGFTDHNCMKCDHGYYGYPKCRRCSCELSGTDKIQGKCDQNGICQCNADGACPCKANVDGRRCNTCKDGTFGLHIENPDGCTQCFCFGRSTKCTEAGLTWGKIRSPNRTLTIDFIDSNTNKHEPITSNDIIDSNNFIELPATPLNIKRANDHFDIPIYWKLPISFNEDRVLSYGGYLRFKTPIIGTNLIQPNDLFRHYPLVRLEGNGVKLNYKNLLVHPTNHEIRFHESLWKFVETDKTASRNLLMIALQNLTGIYIKATDYSDFEEAGLYDVSIDTAIEISGNPPPLAMGVEKCDCPYQYDANSCQNPSIGFYRSKSELPWVISTILIDPEKVIGESIRCQCNDRSVKCDIETGYCLDCIDNTAGEFCEICAEGFYGDPMQPGGKCQACPCPSELINFAKSCSRNNHRTNAFTCICKKGYTGPKCDTCSPGYFGDATIQAGSCEPCNCNEHGSTNTECNQITGNCQCKLGITGPKCSQCEESRHILENNKCIPCDHCVQMLLNDVDDMAKYLKQNTTHLINGMLQPPWKSLKQIEERYDNVSAKFEWFLDTRDNVTDLIDESEIDLYEKQVNDIETAYNKQQAKLDELEISKQQNEKLINTLENEIYSTKNKITNITASLNKFINSHVSTKKALEMGKDYLKDIQEDKNIIDSYKNPIEIQKCKEISKMINELLSKPRTDPKEISNKIEDFSNKVNALEVILIDIKQNNKITAPLNDDNEDLYEQVSAKLKDIQEKNNLITNDLKEIEDTNNKTNNILDQITKIYNILLDDQEFNKSIDQLKEINDKFKDLDIDDLYVKIKDHSDLLEKNVTHNAQLFNLNDDELRTVEASKRYSDIIEILKEANNSANSAIDDLNTIIGTEISPLDDDSLYTNSSLNQAGSDRLQERINVVKNKITDKKQQLNGLYSIVDNFKRDNWQNGITNNKHSDTINQMIPDYNSKTQALKKIEDVIKTASAFSDEMNTMYKTAQSINVSMQYDLVKKYKKYLNLTSMDNIQQLKKTIKVTTGLLENNFINNKTNVDLIKDWNTNYTNFHTQTESLQDKIKSLRANIKKAQEMAASIHVSLTGKDCTRHYRLRKLEPTLLTNITVKFNYKKNEGGSLFHIKNNLNQYMNLDVNENNVRFLWRFAETEYKIELPINYLSADAESFINIRRINNKVTLNVNNNKKETVMKEVNQLFKINYNSLLVLGKSHDESIIGIPGCIRDINFNDERIGIWEFEKQEGVCSGCSRNSSGLSENIKYRFNGDGYVDDPNNDSKIKPSQINIKLKMRTFDENSLIFLVPHPEGAFMAISLHNGHLRYEIHYNTVDKNKLIKPIILETAEKYNNGKEVIIDCIKESSKLKNIVKEHAAFTVNSIDKLHGESNVDSSKAILKFKKSHLYFGGLPPDFSINATMGHVIKDLHTKQPFNGILYDISIADYFSVQNKPSFGIGYQTENELSHTNVLFDTSSYVKLLINTSVSNNTINFVMRTKIDNAFMLSIEESDGTQFPFILQDGRIVIKSINCTTIFAYNDDDYHLVYYDALENSLSVDGKEHKCHKKQKNDARNNIDSSTLWIGGMENESNHFRGVIKDIIINNELIKINSTTYESSEGAKIGRIISPKQDDIDDDTTDNDTNIDNVTMNNMNDMQHTNGCEPVNYELEPNAAKFGDAPNSYVKHNFKDGVWKRDFTIELEFRTFYKNGLLLLAYGPKNHFNLLQIREGRVELKINNSKRGKIIKTQLKVDDGNWHRITVQNSITIKNKRKLLITVDTERSKAMKIPQNKVGRSLYIGDIPKNESGIPINMINPFRGCIRGLKLNNLAQGLVNGKNTYHHQIGQCFPNIEMGSYFRGDSYAIYDHNFKLNNYLDLNFEFRTDEQNGVLLSVSNNGNSPAFSIELQNGAVVMSVDMGNGIITNVTNSLSKAETSICNNSWHHVIAVLSTELTVNVDGVSQSWVLSDAGSLDEIDAPLYIGGLPDQAPLGTLKTRDNFKGCIRNLKIGENIKDWTDMTLYNVALNSCPVIL